MFSTPNSGLVPHSDGMFTRYSASTNRTNGDNQSDLIAFLSIVQKFNVDYLPITWQPALRTLGVGGSGSISQSTFMADMPLAFKRFHDDGDSDFLPLISEVLILSQPPIQSHPNIVNLEGICWEIKPRTEKAVPVLVFEKAAWDLQQFMNVHEGMHMSIEDRLRICADIGSAIMALHAYDVIHGDIKPQNVLIFKDETTGKTAIKVADFGYSTLARGEAEKIFLPKSRPWNAPEHHFGEFNVLQAKRTDVYSFGMLCLWVLFGTVRIPQNTTQCTFDASTGPRTWLEQLKDDDKVDHIVNQLVESVPLADLTAKRRIHLKEFFSLTVSLNPEKRSCDIENLLSLVGEERIEWQPLNTGPLETTRELSMNANFRIAENLADLIAVDYRVRTQIKDSLEKAYVRNQHQSCAAHIAFQIAFCYRIGFGAKSDDDICHTWLERSNKLKDLKFEKQAVQPASWRSARISALSGLVWVDLILEYRSWGLQKLEQARKQYEREIDDMTQEFGEFHFIPIALCRIFGNLLNELGEYRKAEALRMRIRNETEKRNGIDHPSTLTSMEELASTYKTQGRWNEAQELEAKVMEMRRNALGKEHPDTLTIMCNLAITFLNQGRWKEAEELFVQVMETKQRVLGQEHPDTLTNISNLASTYSHQGRLKEAEELEEQVMETRKRVLGQDHQDTMNSKMNLASIFKDQGRWKDAEKMEKQVMETRHRVLGEEHTDTLTSMNNLALTYMNQGRWNEAEEVFGQVMETSKRVHCQEHPYTMKTMGNLASAYRNQGRWKEAEELEVQVMQTFKRVLGQEHPDTLTSMSSLASTYSNQGRWKEAEELEEQVMETRKRVLGQEHLQAITSMGNLALIYWDNGRWKEAEELGVQVVEIEKRVLGQEHPNTMTSMGNLASTYMNQKRWKDAEKLLVQVMETFQRVLGQEHPDTLTSKGNLASTYRNQGRWKEAEELEEKVMETFRRVLGEDHPSTLTSMNNLASTYLNQGRWKEAEELQIEMTTRIRTTLGENHPSTRIAKARLASLRKKHEMLLERSGNVG